jgi:hypothetical protein
MLRSWYGIWYPRAGFSTSEEYFDRDASVDRFCSLSGSGIVHIRSHGWAYPDEGAIDEVFLMTGETYNEATTARHWVDLTAGKILLAQYKGNIVYWVSPEFFAAHNDFKKDTTFAVGSDYAERGVGDSDRDLNYLGEHGLSPRDISDIQQIACCPRLPEQPGLPGCPSKSGSRGC